LLLFTTFRILSMHCCISFRNDCSREHEEGKYIIMQCSEIISTVEYSISDNFDLRK
ncbi:hypothetical protein L9F63_025751, partial [Diploptera punctata]